MRSPALSLPKENACGCVDTTDSQGESGCICTATGFVQIIGRKHALTILNVLSENKGIGFSVLRDSVGDLSSSTLAIRLTELERAGLIKRQRFLEVPPRVSYDLTEQGEQLRRELLSLSRVASRRSAQGN